MLPACDLENLILTSFGVLCTSGTVKEIELSGRTNGHCHWRKTSRRLSLSFSDRLQLFELR